MSNSKHFIKVAHERMSEPDSYSELRAAIVLQALADIESGLKALTIRAARFGSGMCKSHNTWTHTMKWYKEAFAFLEDEDNELVDDYIRIRALKTAQKFVDDYFKKYLGLTEEERERFGLWANDCPNHKFRCPYQDCGQCAELRKKICLKRFGRETYEKADSNADSVANDTCNG